jgi:Spy/CpxP family protein refolding chaperone
MKRATIAALISLLLVMPAFAIDGGGPPQGPGQNLEQRKAEILKRIDERLARLQQMKACIQRARTQDDARACREKFEVRDRPENRRR